MKIAIVSSVAFLLVGCGTQKPAGGQIHSTAMEPSDIKIAARFLDAVYRPRHTPDKIIVDASAEESHAHTPLGIRNRELASRLEIMRHPPEHLRLVINSGDRPTPYGSSQFIFDYDRHTGRLTPLGPHITGSATSESSNMWLDIRHWPNGTRLVCASLWWINDSRRDVFHLRLGESKFIFAVSTIPLID
jgi:hypothetical protein